MDVVFVEAVFDYFVHRYLSDESSFFLICPVFDFLRIWLLMAFIGKLHFGAEKLSFQRAHFQADKGKYRVIIPKTHRQVILTELLRYENFLSLLKVQNHQFFGQIDFFEYATAVPDSFEAPHTHYKVQLFLNLLLCSPLKFVLQLMSILLLLKQVGLPVQISEYVETRVFLQQGLDLVLQSLFLSHIHGSMLNFAVFHNFHWDDVFGLAQVVVDVRLSVILALLPA